MLHGVGTASVWPVRYMLLHGQAVSSTQATEPWEELSELVTETNVNIAKVRQRMLWVRV
jgi:hypothetical protein